MSAFYRSGENKTRPGVYRQFVDRSKVNPFTTGRWTPEWDYKLTVVYDEETATLKLSCRRMTVTYNGVDTVTVKGLRHTYDANTVTIGG